MRVHIDFETRSAVDLNKAGVHAYAESPTTDVWCAAYSIDDGPIELWFPGRSYYPRAIHHAAAYGATFVAWNAAFDRIVWEYILGPRYGWPVPKLEQWRCSMAAALAMGFPAALARAAPAAGLDITKDAKGAGLMKRMMRPRSANVFIDGSVESYVWWDEPEKLEQLGAYCVQDVEVERQIYKRLVPLTADEQEMWVLDQRINDRGLHVDLELCNAAKAIVTTAASRLNADMVEATEGLVQTCSNIGALSRFCAENGVEVDSLRKDKVTTLLTRTDLPDSVRDALELRQDAAKASVKKIDSALAGRSSDGRAKGLFSFNGAGTGRWAGRRFQPQNLQRPAKGVDVDQIIADTLSGDYDVVEMFHGAPLAAIGNAIRGIVAAAPGNRLIAADYSNIEGRVLAWLAGEQWKLDAFAAFDAGTGEDLYRVAYGRSFGIPPDTVDSNQRQIGKTMELALGYQGGVVAFQSMARIYGVDIGQSYEMLCAGDMTAAKTAAEAYETRGKGSGIGRESWIAAEIVVWRGAHPNVTKFWYDLNDAAVAALDRPGEKVMCGPLCFLKAGSFMWLRLPSGRPLCYPYPRLSEKVMPWKDKHGKPATKLTFTFKAEVKRQWVDSYAYGGLWAENVTQAAARDLLAEAMKRLEAAGYPIVSHAHDEAVAEVPQGFGSVEAFCSVMTQVPAWAEGCPIAAAGWAGDRYRKA